MVPQAYWRRRLRPGDGRGPCEGHDEILKSGKRPMFRPADAGVGFGGALMMSIVPLMLSHELSHQNGAWRSGRRCSNQRSCVWPLQSGQTPRSSPARRRWRSRKLSGGSGSGSGVASRAPAQCGLAVRGPLARKPRRRMR